MHPIKISGILQTSCFFLLHVLSTLCFFVICCSCCSLYQTFCRFYYLTITLYVAKIKFSSYSWIIFNVQVFELNERTHSQLEYSKVCFRSFIGYFLWISFRFFIAPARREPVESEDTPNVVSNNLSAKGFTSADGSQSKGEKFNLVFTITMIYDEICSINFEGCCNSLGT